jgi:putative ABC transport system permease protein
MSGGTEAIQSLLRLPGAGFRHRLLRTVQTGFKSLWLHRLRSLLTVLGIVFGVSSVIAMLAVGEGASFDVQEQIRQLGSSNIIVRSVRPTEQQRASQGTSYVIEYGITYSDITQIRNSLPGVEVIMPGRAIRQEVSHGSRRQFITILGTVPWYPAMREARLIEGRFFTDVEMEERRNVCVLTRDAVRGLFPVSSPIGRNVRAGTDYYKVVGVVDNPGTAATQEPSSNPNAEGGAMPGMFIPLTAARHRFGEVLVSNRSGSREAARVQLHEAVIRVQDQSKVEETAAIVEAMLERNHKKRDYEIVVPLRLLRSAERTQQIFNLVLGAIAAISLIVGGIGIMNIMLASVTERTREIGIRRALGAKRRDILTQFLTETVLLSGAGGVLGVALGLLIPLLISVFADMRTIVTPWALGVAFSISALVGVVFGIYPAYRAAHMDPVEALRHE